jgi:hypothetical protein
MPRAMPGEITELSRGVFRLADAPPASFPDLLAVRRSAPVRDELQRRATID